MTNFARLAIAAVLLSTTACGGGDETPAADSSAPAADSSAPPAAEVSAAPSEVSTAPALSLKPRRASSPSDIATPEAVASAFFETLQSENGLLDVVAFLDEVSSDAWTRDVGRGDVQVRLDTFKILSVREGAFGEYQRGALVTEVTYEATGELCTTDEGCSPIGPGALQAQQQSGFVWKLNNNDGLAQRLIQAVRNL